MKNLKGLVIGLILGTGALVWAVNPVPFDIINLTTGLRIGGSATSGEFLRGNGTNFISGTIQDGDLPSTLASKTLTTPVISGKADADGGAVDDDDCTGEQGFFWYDDTDSAFEFCNANSGAPAALGTGSSITFDIGDDGGDDSTDVSEIATTGDTNSIFTEPSADKILIAVGNNWPTADAVADDGVTEAALKAVDAAGDEECLTYETTTGDFEWQACGGAGGGDAFSLVWNATQASLPASSFAQQDTRNAHPVLDFDAAADECAYFSSILPAGYGGGGLTLRIFWMATSATSGATGWLAAIERQDDDAVDLDSDSFAADNSVSATTASASGEVDYATITWTDGVDADSLAAGESFRLRVCRDGDGSVVTDDMTGDAELLRVELRET